MQDQYLWEERQVELWRKAKVALHLAMEQERLYRERVLIPRLRAGMRNVLTGADVDDLRPDTAYNDAHPSCAAKRAIIRYHLHGEETATGTTCDNINCACAGAKVPMTR